jgi:hypothetical protein
MIGEQLIMLFSNLILFIPFLISLRTKYLTFIFFTFGVAVASNLYHISNNSDMLEKIFSLTPYQISDIFDFDLSVELKLFFLFLDYFFSNTLSAILIITLAPKSGESIVCTSLNFVTCCLWMVALFLGADIKATTPDTSMLAPLITVFVWSLLCYAILTYYYLKNFIPSPILNNLEDKGKIIKKRKKNEDFLTLEQPQTKWAYFKKYYEVHFNWKLLLVGIIILLIGLIIWSVIQPMVPELYFFTHPGWHLCITLGSSFILYSILTENWKV